MQRIGGGDDRRMRPRTIDRLIELREGGNLQLPPYRTRSRFVEVDDSAQLRTTRCMQRACVREEYPSGRRQPPALEADHQELVMSPTVSPFKLPAIRSTAQ